MLNFYPGPSRLYNEIDLHIQEALKTGIISMNHRSSTFMELYASVQKSFEQYLELPKDYRVYFTSSATECWEIIGESFTGQSFLHVFNGEFGKKWADANQHLGNSIYRKIFDIQSTIPLEYSLYEASANVVCLTQVETSNGTYISGSSLEKMRLLFPEAMLAVDATSGIGGMTVDWTNADIWFGSVQKCFGLPSGLGILILSPRCIEKVNNENIKAHYNSLKRLVSNGQKHQTTHTPNILGIYLLNKRLENLSFRNYPLILKKRMDGLHNHYSQHIFLQPLINERAVQSNTILTLKGDRDYLSQIKKTLKNQNIIIGKGYGLWKESTIRIANFPAHSDDEFKELLMQL